MADPKRDPRQVELDARREQSHEAKAQAWDGDYFWETDDFDENEEDVCNP